MPCVLAIAHARASPESGRINGRGLISRGHLCRLMPAITGRLFKLRIV